MPALRRSVYRDFKEIMLAYGWWNDRCMNKSEFVYTFPNGSWVEFFSCENEQKMRGSKRKVLFVNEANELQFIEWQQLQMRTTLFSIIDYNPSFSDEHWINLINKEKNTYHFISTYKDNPFLEKKVIDEIESLQWKNKSLWQVYGLGMQAIVEGLVFENVEIIEEIPSYHKKHHYRGMDLGYAADPTAIEDVYIYNDLLYIDEICYQTKMLSSDIINVLKEADRRDHTKVEVISESADPRMIDEIYNAGIDIKPVRKFGGSIEAGVSKMQEFKIKITKRSTNVIKEFKNYTYRQDKEGKWLNQPIDAYNHCFCAGTMVTTSTGLKPIEKMEQGDLVLTSRGYKKCEKLFIQGRREVWRVRLEFGNFVVELNVTPDHKIKTTKGWKEVQELTVKDVLYLCNISTAKDTQSTKVNGIIREALRNYTGLYGNTTMAKDRKDFTYIIKTVILRTMKLKILNYWKVANTCMNTLSKYFKKKAVWRKCVNVCNTQESQLTNGTVQTKADSGINCKQSEYLKICKRESLFANAVERLSCIYLLAKTCFVQESVNRNGVEITDLTMRNECVPLVGRHSLSTNIQEQNAVVENVLTNISVLSKSVKMTYDISVEDEHEFFANGVLVHNCIDGIRYVCMEKVLGQNSNGLDAAGILDLL